MTYVNKYLKYQLLSNILRQTVKLLSFINTICFVKIMKYVFIDKNNKLMFSKVFFTKIRDFWNILKTIDIFLIWFAFAMCVVLRKKTQINYSLHWGYNI